MSEWDDADENGEIKIRDRVLRPVFGDKPVVIHRRGPERSCWHEFVVLVYSNMHNVEQVRCRTCKQRLDPLIVLEKLARNWESATYASAELQKLSARVEELKHEETLIKGRLRGARKKIEDSRADIYFGELLRRINAAQAYADQQEVRNWERSFAWLSTEQNMQLVEAWRHAERRFEDHLRHVKKQQKAGVRVLEGGKQE